MDTKARLTNSLVNIFCEACNAQSVAVEVVDIKGNRTPCTGNEITGGSDFSGVNYTLAMCRSCESPVLFEKKVIGSGDAFGEAVSEHVLYPQTLNPTLRDCPATVRQNYEEAIRCYKASLYKPAVIMARLSIEAAVKDLNGGKDDLAKQIRQLVASNIIDSRLAGWADGVRLIGNKSAHEPDEKVSKKDAKMTLDFVEAFLNNIYVLNAHFQTFQQRGARNKTPLTP